ncbi:hypothetical protein LHGZ1_1732 [Laribacter hongkongensis]|uniref:Uncharacterized protein n=1 Tax=Laribacter hongkongensis TaxID=168471 RepID=A0A248LK62_9NEIS|nr:hypothetical protein LHGZ1_1732 [Laribacter hongkongensis]
MADTHCPDRATGVTMLPLHDKQADILACAFTPSTTGSTPARQPAA